MQLLTTFLTKHPDEALLTLQTELKTAGPHIWYRSGIRNANERKAIQLKWQTTMYNWYRLSAQKYQSVCDRAALGSHWPYATQGW